MRRAQTVTKFPVEGMYFPLTGHFNNEEKIYLTRIVFSFEYWPGKKITIKETGVFSVVATKRIPMIKNQKDPHSNFYQLKKIKSFKYFNFK